MGKKLTPGKIERIRNASFPTRKRSGSPFSKKDAIAGSISPFEMSPSLTRMVDRCLEEEASAGDGLEDAAWLPPVYAIKGPTGPTGPIGPAGVPGPPGTPWPSPHESYYWIGPYEPGLWIESEPLPPPPCIKNLLEGVLEKDGTTYWYLGDGKTVKLIGKTSSGGGHELIEEDGPMRVMEKARRLKLIEEAWDKQRAMEAKQDELS